MSELSVHGTKMGFDKAASSLIHKARRLSVRYSSTGISQPFPAIQQELLFLAFIDLHHPIYLALANRFSLSTPIIKNMLHSHLMKTEEDAPSDDNYQKEAAFFKFAEEEAAGESSYHICDNHLLLAIFKCKSPPNAVLDIMKTEFGLKEKELVKFVGDFETLDVSKQRDRTIVGDQQVNGYLDSLHKIKKFFVESPEQPEPIEESGRDVTEQSSSGTLPKILGRDQEINSIGEIIARKEQNSVLLVGHPGVGKTAVVEGFAEKARNDSNFKRYKGITIVETDVNGLALDAKNANRFIGRLKNMFDTAVLNPNRILYFPDIHDLMAPEKAGGHEFVTTLKSFLAKGKFRILASTTYENFQKYIQKDASLAWHFKTIKVDEPSIDLCHDILNALSAKYEKHHGVKIEKTALEASIEFSDRYLKSAHLPGKALSVLDWAASRVSLTDKKNKTVTREDIAHIISDKTDIPVSQILFSQEVIFQNLEQKLKDRVIGQDYAIRRIVDVLYLTKYEMDMKPERPDGVFLITGPTGTGKTELAKSLAHILLGKEEELVRLDMSEFMEKHNVARLIGAPPGYKDSDAGGMLTNAVKENPYSIILLDEVEKAHQDVFKLFLQVFDDGRLTDAMGQTVDFSHSTIIMTSNLGTDKIRAEEVSMIEEDKRQDYIRERVEPSIKKWFPPEFLNRLDDILYFNFLSTQVIEKIATKKMEMVLKRFQEKDKKISVTQKLTDHIIQNGYNPEYGCRHLNRTIEDVLLKPLTKYVIQNSSAKEILCDLDGSKNIQFSENAKTS